MTESEMSEGALIAKLLRKIANAVEDLNGEELARFIDGIQKGATLSRAQKGLKPVRKSGGRQNLEVHVLTKIFDELRDQNSRMAGFRILDSHELVRDDLARLAKLRNVHVTKDDSVSLIKEKLVEAAIGSRLGSKAVRGE
jgi:hypothetical protein